MGISNVKTSRDLSSAIYYFSNKPHNGHSERYISSRFVNCTEKGCIQQTKAVREHFGKDKNVHGLTFVFSFSDKEIGLFERDKQERIMDSLRDVLKERYGNRQIGLFAQIDGTGQKFHVHGFVNSPDLTTGKLIDGRLKLHENAREMLSEAMSRANIEDLNKNVPTKQAIKTDIAIIKAKEKNPGVYIWKEDLQNRINSVLNDSSVTDKNKFEEALFAKGISINVRKSKKTKSGFACSYSFTDNDGKKRVARATKLGTDFQIEAINACLKRHREIEIEEREKQEKFDRKQRESKPQVRHEQMHQTVSKRSKIDSKPLVQKIDKSVPRNSQKPSQRLSEPLRAVSENKTVNNITENVKASRSENRASEQRSENPLLNFIKNFKFVMYDEKGMKLPALGDVARTFEQHANSRSNRVLSDEELLYFAEKIPFTIPFADKSLNRFLKPQTLLEKFEKERSTKDLIQKADIAMNDFQTKSTDKDLEFEQ